MGNQGRKGQLIYRHRYSRQPHRHYVFFFRNSYFGRELKSIWCFLWKLWNTICWYGGLAWWQDLSWEHSKEPFGSQGFSEWLEKWTYLGWFMDWTPIHMLGMCSGVVAVTKRTLCVWAMCSSDHRISAQFKSNDPYYHICICIIRTNKTNKNVQLTTYCYLNWIAILKSSSFNCLHSGKLSIRSVQTKRFSSETLLISRQLEMYSPIKNRKFMSDVIITPALAWSIEVPLVKYCQHCSYKRSVNLEDMVTFNLLEWQIWSGLLQMCRCKWMPTAPKCLVTIVLFYPITFKSVPVYHIWFVRFRLDCCLHCLISTVLPWI